MNLRTQLQLLSEAEQERRTRIDNEFVELYAPAIYDDLKAACKRVAENGGYSTLFSFDDEWSPCPSIRRAMTWSPSDDAIRSLAAKVRAKLAAAGLTATFIKNGLVLTLSWELEP